MKFNISNKEFVNVLDYKDNKKLAEGNKIKIVYKHLTVLENDEIVSLSTEKANDAVSSDMERLKIDNPAKNEKVKNKWGLVYIREFTSQKLKRTVKEIKNLFFENLEIKTIEQLQNFPHPIANEIYEAIKKNYEEFEYNEKK